MKKVAYALSAALCLLAARAEANASIYHGFPHLHLTMAAVDAGGGARSFNSRRLMDRLAGPRAAAENAKLVRQYGPARVDAYYAVYTYAMTDAIKKAHNMLIPLPGSAHPTPNDAPALAIALYNAGITPAGRWDVGYMLEVLMSHQIHHNIMGDMDRQFTGQVNGEFHMILTTAMHDLKREYATVSATDFR
jgi:hypothetical protein